MAYSRPTLVRGSASAIGTSASVAPADIVGYVSFSTISDNNQSLIAIEDDPPSGNREWLITTKTGGGTAALSRLAGNVIGGTNGAGVLVNFTGPRQVMYPAQIGEFDLLGPQTSDPTAILSGAVWFRTDTGQVRLHDGSSVRQQLGPASIDKGGRVFDIRAYGAKCDGTTDDAAAINALISGLPASGGKIYIPAATCAIGSTITVLNRSGVSIEGERGVQTLPNTGSVLKWIGSSGGTMLDLNGFQRANVKGIIFDGNSLLAGVGMHVHNDSPATIGTGNLDLDQLFFRNCLIGIQEGLAGTNQGNNSEVCLFSTEIVGCTTGISFESSQGGQWHIFNIMGSGAQNFIKTGFMPTDSPGFHVYSGSLGNNQIDFELPCISGSVTIENLASENVGAYFIKSDSVGEGHDQQGAHITVRGCSVSYGVNGKFCRFRPGGSSLLVEDCQFQTSDPNLFELGTSATGPDASPTMVFRHCNLPGFPTLTDNIDGQTNANYRVIIDDNYFPGFPGYNRTRYEVHVCGGGVQRGPIPVLLDQNGLDRSFWCGGISPPLISPLIDLSGGGSFAAGTVFGVITELDVDGNETFVSQERSVVVATNDRIQWGWQSQTKIAPVAYRLYRGTTAGGEAHYIQRTHVGTPDNFQVYNDSGPVTSGTAKTPPREGLAFLTKIDGSSGTLRTPALSGVFPVSDSTVLLADDADATKTWRVEIGGFATGHANVFTPPDASYTGAGINIPQTYTAEQHYGSDGSGNAGIALMFGGTSTDFFLGIGGRFLLRKGDNSGNVIAMEVNGVGDLGIGNSQGSVSFIPSAAGVIDLLVGSLGATGLRVQSGDAQVVVYGRDAAWRSFAVRMASGQTANPSEIWDSTNTMLHSFEPTMVEVWRQIADAGSYREVCTITPGFADNTNASWKGKMLLGVTDSTNTRRTFLEGRTDGVATQVYRQASASTLMAKLTGTIIDHNADANNAGVGETDLYSDTLPANIFNYDNDKVDAEYYGLFATSINSKQIRAYFAGTLIFDTGALAISTAGNWQIDILVFRTSSSTARVGVKFSSSSSVLAASAKETDLTGLDFTTAKILKITGTGGATADITAKLAFGEWKPGGTIVNGSLQSDSGG